MTDLPTIVPVVLSGGSGTRLWPLSRAESPKQLLRLVEARTMLQATVLRATGERFGAPVIVGSAGHAEVVAAQLDDVGVGDPVIILEPAARNTAPAIALAAAHLTAAGAADALMLVMPSDHVIADADAFRRAIDAAAPFAADGWLVTFGIRATEPETGYGYIRIGERLGEGVSRVDRFVEKPDRATAEGYLAGGDHAWNGGIFLFRADRYLDELGAHAPAMRDAAAAAIASARRDGAFLRPDADAFAASPSDSIDYAVMERSARVAVVAADMGWSDVGSWDALWAIGDRDERGNGVQGDVITIDADGCLIRSDGPLVVAVGVRDLTIVATADAVLVVPRGRAQDVKLAVDALAQAGRGEHRLACSGSASWGEDRVLARGPGSTVRELRIAPGATATLEAGRHDLTVLDGTGTLYDGGPGIALAPGARATITGKTLVEAGPDPLRLLDVRDAS